MRLRLTAIFLCLSVSVCAAGVVNADTPKVSAVTRSVEWKSGNDLFVAGQDLTVDRKVDGALTVTGETVALTRDVTVKDNTWIAGQHVAVEGDLGGDLSIRSQDALINGHVAGDVSFYGMTLIFGSDARIDGNVRYYASAPAEIDEGAEIKGEVRPTVLHDKASITQQWGNKHHWSMPGYDLSLGGAIFFGIIALIVALVSPGTSPRLREAIRMHPAFAFLVGFVWLFCTPLLAIIAAISIIGIPLAILVLLLWPLGVLAGLVASILALADVFIGRFTFGEEGAIRRIVAVALASLITWLSISMPALGPLIWFLAITVGIGAMALSARARVFGF